MADSRPPKVLVFMATYNAGEPLRDQIESILIQDGVAVDLLISDDGSTDGTVELCEWYADALPNVTFRRNGTNLGVIGNFMTMVHDADPASHDYYAFADQDDFWLTDKLERAVGMLVEAGPNALYYSDVTHIDVETGALIPSHAGLYRGRERDLGALLVGNWAAGCTMVFDAGLLRLLQIQPPERITRVHDAWVHLVALTCGQVVPDLGHSAILHRITRGNATLEQVDRDFGRLSPKRLAYAFGHLFGERDRTYSSAASRLLETYGALMDSRSRELVELVASLPHSPASRLRAAVNPDLSLPTFSEDAMLRVRILLDRL